MSQTLPCIHHIGILQCLLRLGPLLRPDVEDLALANAARSEARSVSDLCCGKHVSSLSPCGAIIAFLVASDPIRTASPPEGTLPTDIAPKPRAIASSVARLIFDVISIYRTDLSYLSMQTSLLSLTEEFCGIICSCLFILPRLYRHLTSSSTYHQQGYMLRKYKMVKPPMVETPRSTGGAPLAEFTYGSDGGPDAHPTWDRDIEAPATLPCQAHHSVSI